MVQLKIYLDNCCYGRPFDDHSQVRIKNEAAAKMYIQSLVRFNSLVLCSSFMLYYEISKCPIEDNKDHIFRFVDEFSSFFISEELETKIKPISDDIMATGIKYKDSVHLACSIIAECDYFITTDDRVLNHKTDRIKITDPVKFVKIWREKHDR